LALIQLQDAPDLALHEQGPEQVDLALQYE
jgi:hypothetical protein